jgi:tRNA threonylcarbamoyladenosine biosynthesis protein TsaB
MTILTIRTDKPEAELGLWQDGKEQAGITWLAHRQLAETIHTKITDLLESRELTLQDIQGLVCYKGPGSFTGLRIGLSVGNALAYSLNMPIVSASGEKWQAEGITRLEKNENEHTALPEYGAPVFTTQQKK